MKTVAVADGAPDDTERKMLASVQTIFPPAISSRWLEATPDPLPTLRHLPIRRLILLGALLSPSDGDQNT